MLARSLGKQTEKRKEKEKKRKKKRKQKPRRWNLTTAHFRFLASVAHSGSTRSPTLIRLIGRLVRAWAGRWDERLPEYVEAHFVPLKHEQKMPHLTASEATPFV
jgi:hypothetical protein